MNTTKNWIAAFAAAAGLLAAIVGANAVASADPGTAPVGTTAEAPAQGSSAGAPVTEVKLDD